jgi:LytS/YehU family sensor histidine kinase
MADISSGAPQETRVRNDLSEPEDAQSQLREQEKNSTGIGLRNVSNRLNLFYKRDGLLSIYSEGRDQGTEVTVLLPLTQEEQRNVSDTDRG